MKNMTVTNKEKLGLPTSISKNQRMMSTNMRMSTNIDMRKGRFPDDLANIKKTTTIHTNKNKKPKRMLDINIDVPSKKGTNDDITTR